jgi:hypothetical protein
VDLVGFEPAVPIQGKRFFRQKSDTATQPRKDNRRDLVVLAEVVGRGLGISNIQLRCDTLRDYFYVASRNCAFDGQPSFYELPRTSPKASLTELRLAFRLRSLELRAEGKSSRELATLERAFNIVGRPELRVFYDALLADPAAPVLFPYGGFGCLLVAGETSRESKTFFASRILTFSPQQKVQRIRAPLRRFIFYDDHAVYLDSRSKLEIGRTQVSGSGYPVESRPPSQNHLETEPRSTQAALRFEDSRVAAMKRMPSTPSSTLGTSSEAGEGLRFSRRAKICSAKSV